MKLKKKINSKAINLERGEKSTTEPPIWEKALRIRGKKTKLRVKKYNEKFNSSLLNVFKTEVTRIIK